MALDQPYYSEESFESNEPEQRQKQSKVDWQRDNEKMLCFYFEYVLRYKMKHFSRVLSWRNKKQEFYYVRMSQYFGSRKRLPLTKAQARSKDQNLNKNYSQKTDLVELAVSQLQRLKRKYIQNNLDPKMIKQMHLTLKKYFRAFKLNEERKKNQFGDNFWTAYEEHMKQQEIAIKQLELLIK